MLRRARVPARLSVLAVAVAVLAACGGGSGSASSAPGTAPATATAPATRSTGSLGPGFYTPGASPGPESTITPAPGSWDGMHPGPGYTVALLVDGVPGSTSAQTAVLRDAVRGWAEAETVRLTEITAKAAGDYVGDIQRAIDDRPDLVISVGEGFVDPLALVTASNLPTQFLVVGAETAEPTGNVTAADWSGAGFRGEGLGQSTTYDPRSFTPERADRALRAGVAAVLAGLTGIVVWVS